ncbi:PAS domain S-box protein [Leptolyngbya sp. DQ-M1]|uniref:PAS domain S-box protein n=1 Tax=Leptolyngbya sp. DQ-M1 TaxID=2933920 RepID=UPI00329A2700
MKQSLVRQINAGFSITLVLVLINGVISYRNIFRLVDNERLVRQSHQVIAVLEDTLSTLKDAETGQRGYLLTGQDQYLEPYNSAITRVSEQVQTLKQLKTRTTQPQQIEVLEQAITAKLTELNQTIQLRRTGKFDEALRIVRSDRGKRIMDNIRTQIAVLERQETDQLQQRTAESQQHLSSALFTFTLITGTSLILLALLAELVRRNEAQRQQAERSLREREERLQTFVKYAPASIAMFNETMHYLAVSQRWIEDYHPGSIESVLGKSHYDLFPNQPARWRAAHQRGLAGHSEKCDEDRYVLLDGSEQFLRWEVQPWQDNSARVKGILIAVEDITQQKRIEVALRESEQQFKVTFNQAAVGIAQVAPNGTWLRVNQKLCEIVGYRYEELLACTFQDITHPADLDLDLSYMRQMIAGEIQTYSIEKRYIRKDRSIVWINLTVALVRDSDGQPKYFISVIEDIDHRKRLEAERQQAELALRQSEERFRSAMEFSGIGTWDWNLLTEQVIWNDNSFRLLGYEPHGCEPNYQTWRNRVHPDDIEATEQAIQSAISTRSFYFSDFRVVWDDDSVHWISARGRAVYNDTEQPIRLLGVMLNITERKAAEIALQQLNATLEQRIEDRTTRLTEINQELEAFTYSVSHDLRAPLRIMQGFAQALEEDYGTHLDDLAHTYIQSISDSAVQMGTLIDDLLSYSRLSRTQINLQPTELNAVVDAALRQLQREIEERHAVVQIQSPLPSVIANRPILIQVVTNLISNALKFVEPSNQPAIIIAAQVEKNSVSLTIEDNGIGIAPEYQDRIFGVFERLHGIETFPGTGIGLAIVRKGIDRMGGQVGVESQLGHGSRFWIVLPLASNQIDSPHDSNSHSLN